jgi:hypothetical protein
LIIFDYIENV